MIWLIIILYLVMGFGIADFTQLVGKSLSRRGYGKATFWIALVFWPLLVLLLGIIVIEEKVSGNG